MAHLSKYLNPIAQGWPSCFKAIGALTLLLEETLKLTLGASIQVYTSHNIPNLLQYSGFQWLSDNRLLKYQAMLLENPDITVATCSSLNPATLLPEEPIRSCQEVLLLSLGPRPDLTD